MKKATPEQMKASMDAWKVWVQKHGPALVDMGAPLGDSALIKGKPGQGHIDGYSMVQAESLDTVKRMFEAHPHLGAPGACASPISRPSVLGRQQTLRRCKGARHARAASHRNGWPS